MYIQIRNARKHISTEAREAGNLGKRLAASYLRFRHIKDIYARVVEMNEKDSENELILILDINYRLTISQTCYGPEEKFEISKV